MSPNRKTIAAHLRLVWEGGPPAFLWYTTRPVKSCGCFCTFSGEGVVSEYIARSAWFYELFLETFRVHFQNVMGISAHFYGPLGIYVHY